MLAAMPLGWAVFGSPARPFPSAAPSILAPRCSPAHPECSAATRVHDPAMNGSIDVASRRPTASVIRRGGIAMFEHHAFVRRVGQLLGHVGMRLAPIVVSLERQRTHDHQPTAAKNVIHAATMCQARQVETESTMATMNRMTRKIPMSREIMRVVPSLVGGPLDRTSWLDDKLGGMGCQARECRRR